MNPAWKRSSCATTRAMARSPRRLIMWFNNVFLRTLRDFRIAILGWSLGIGLVMFEVEATVGSLIATPVARATLVSLASSFAWNADVVAVDTVGGYATWKVGVFILLIAIWPLLACSRILRGEEERGSMDVLLSLPRGRLQIALEKLAAVWTALLLMGLLIGLITFAGGKSFNADYSVTEAMLFSLKLEVSCGVFGSLALLVSQFTQARGAAAGATGGLLVVFIVLDMVHRVIPGTEWLSRLSPVYYYNLSKPLVPSYGTNPGAMLVLLGLSVLLSGAALWLFARRDVGATIALPRFLRLQERAVRPERALPANAWSLRSVYTRSLAKMAFPTFWWTVVIAGFAAWMVVVAKQTADQLKTLATGSSFMKDLITKIGGGDVRLKANLPKALFVPPPLVFVGFAWTQTTSWSADEEGGGHRWGAALSVVALGRVIAALGYLFSGWLRTAIDTGLLSFLLVIWFFITFVGPGLNWPDGVLRLSAFYYYGTPLLHGLSLANTLGLLAVALVALVLASARFVYKDIGR